MHIRVEPRHQHDRLGPNVQRRDDGLLADLWILCHLRDGLFVQHGDSVKALHRENFLGRKLLVNLGRRGFVQQVVLCQVSSEFLGVSGLLGKIKFFEHRRPNVSHDRRQGRSLPIGLQKFQNPRGDIDETQVGLERGIDAGLLNLDDDVFPRLQFRRVHLRNRRRRKRFGVDVLKGLRDWSQVVFDDPLDDSPLDRFRLVQEFLKLQHVVLREDGRTRRDELSQLYIGRPEFFEQRSDRLGCRKGRRGLAEPREKFPQRLRERPVRLEGPGGPGLWTGIDRGLDDVLDQAHRFFLRAISHGFLRPTGFAVVAAATARRRRRVRREHCCCCCRCCCRILSSLWLWWRSRCGCGLPLR
mmetsp:Transcript_4918/g.11021  ORF Transcript_4918/g.11021 Transcript_4918/m.11021 type:complete len:356 (+) Transcript_4918:1134-2201(+)